MNRQIVAFFASSFLCVAATIPARAEEQTGTVASVDPDGATVTFEDGATFALPGGFDCARVAPGMEAHVIYAGGCA